MQNTITSPDLKTNSSSYIPNRWVKLILFCGLSLGTAFTSAHPSHAQQANRLSLPATDEASPNNGVGASQNWLNMMPSGTRVSRGNVGDWKDRLVPEFIDLIRSGRMTVVAQDEHPILWPSMAWRDELGPEAFRSGQSQHDGTKAASSAKNPSLDNTLRGPYPYGSYESIDKSSSISEQGEKILANINSIFASHGFQRTRAEVLNFDDGKLFRGYKLMIERLYPKLIDPSNSSAQVFREKLTVLDPISLNGLSWLTFRFSGADEDLLFHYSPFSKKSIQLSAPNRVDKIAGTSLALDDLLTWSGKPEILTVSSVEKIKRFFPIRYEKTLKTTDTSGSCTSISKDSSTVLLNTNHSQSDLADWAPLNIPFVERESINLTLSTTDFHNPFGKVVLQVDLETFLPLTKSYYDRNGNLVKFVFSIFDLAEASSKFNFTPLATFTIDKAALSAPGATEEKASRVIGKSQKTSDTSVILYRSDERCSVLPADMSLNDFDLKGFGIRVSSPQDAKSDQAKAIQTTTPQSTALVQQSDNELTKKDSSPSPTQKNLQPASSNLSKPDVGGATAGDRPQKTAPPKERAQLTQEDAPDND